MSKTAAIIRQVCESLQKQFGNAAAHLLYEGIDDATAEIERFFAGPLTVAEEPIEEVPDAAD